MKRLSAKTDKTEREEMKMCENKGKSAGWIKMVMKRFVLYFIIVSLFWVVALTLGATYDQYTDNGLYKECLANGEKAEICVRNIRF